MDSPFLGELGLVLLLIFLIIVVGPLLIGLGLAFVCGLSGALFYGAVIGVAALIWVVLYLFYYY